MLVLLRLCSFNMIFYVFDCWVSKGFSTVYLKKKKKRIFWSERFNSEMLQKLQTGVGGCRSLSSVLNSIHYLTLMDCASCLDPVYKHQKRTAACVIHAAHWLIMSLNKHAKQRAAGLRGKMIFHWQLAQTLTSVDRGLRDVLAPLIHSIQSKRSAALSRPVCIDWIPAVQQARCLDLQLKEEYYIWFSCEIIPPVFCKAL